MATTASCVKDDRQASKFKWVESPAKIQKMIWESRLRFAFSRSCSFVQQSSNGETVNDGVRGVDEKKLGAEESEIDGVQDSANFEGNSPDLHAAHNGTTKRTRQANFLA